MPGTLTRWDPFGDLSELRSQFDRMFGQLEGRERAWTPAIDVTQGENNMVIHADLPGIGSEEVKIEVEDDIITISGEHHENVEEKGKRYVRRERRSGSFSRSIALPPGVDAKKIKASSHDGVVEVTIPIPKEAKKEKVEVKPTNS